MDDRRSIQFSEVVKIPAVQMNGVVLKHVHEQLQNYRENCKLMMSVVNVPVFSIVASLQWSEACTKASRRTFGNKSGDFAAALSQSSERTNRYTRQCHQIMARIVKEESKEVNGASIYNEKIAFFFKAIDQLLAGFEPATSEMFENVLKALVIQAWSAFEEMAKYVWRRAESLNRADFKIPTEKQLRSREFPMGFSSRGKIRNIYEFSFGNSDIDATIDAKFIDPLAFLRNSLTHNGGRSDKEFREGAADFDILKPYMDLDDTQMIPFDGVFVKSAIEPAITAGYNLIQQVDNWLEANK